jgi:hypothetical protein
MLRPFFTFMAAAVFLFLSSNAEAQTSINPDISVIPRFIMQTNDGAKLGFGKREFSRPDYSFEELEFVFQS